MADIDFKKACEIVTDEINNFPAFDYEDILSEVLPRTRKDILEEEFFKNRMMSMQGWYIRASTQKKIEILRRISTHVSNYYTIIHVLNTIYTATCKDWIYSTNQRLSLFKNDKILNDNNRTLDEDILEAVLQDQILFFRTLNDADQYSLLIDMVKLGDSCLFGMIFKELLIILKSKLRTKIQKMLEEEALVKSAEDINNIKGKKREKGNENRKEIKNEKKGNKINNIKNDEINLTKEEIAQEEKRQMQLVLERIEKEKQLEFEQHERQNEKEVEDILNFLNEKFPDESMFSLSAKLNGLLKNWDLFIQNYNKRVGLTKEPRTNKGTKSKGKTNEKISKDSPDQIQLLPIWINKRIIARMDAKELKDAMKINKYWGFIAKEVIEDIKCRQNLDKICAKLKNNLQICNFEKVHTDIELKSKYNHLADVTNPAFRERVQNNYNAQTTFTLLADLYKQCTTFNVCGTKLESFPRFLYAYQLEFARMSASKDSRDSTTYEKLSLSFPSHM